MVNGNSQPQNYMTIKIGFLVITKQNSKFKSMKFVCSELRQRTFPIFSFQNLIKSRCSVEENTDKQCLKQNNSLAPVATIQILWNFARMQTLIQCELYRILQQCKLYGISQEFCPITSFCMSTFLCLWFYETWPALNLKLIQVFHTYLLHTDLHFKGLSINKPCRYMSVVSWIEASQLRQRKMFVINTARVTSTEMNANILTNTNKAAIVLKVSFAFPVMKFGLTAVFDDN